MDLGTITELSGNLKEKRKIGPGEEIGLGVEGTGWGDVRTNNGRNYNLVQYDD